MVSEISALAIDAESDRVDGALFLAILDFSGSKLPDQQPAQPPWRDPASGNGAAKRTIRGVVSASASPGQKKTPADRHR